MNTQNVDIAIIGGGPAGLAAAIEAKKEGVKNILILERNPYLGGILPQCIHDGFGLEDLGVSLTGPEYAERYITVAENNGIARLTSTMALEVNRKREIIATSKKGLYKISAKAIILATGCREKTRWSVMIPGDRPSGIYTAGTAQALINLHNIMPGRRIVILGSGDVGLIMARRLTLEGARVLGVVEILPYPSGLPRNVQLCLYDYQIPLFVNHTVVSIHGKERLEHVKIAPVKKSGDYAWDNITKIDCDTLLISLGLTPENELAGSLGIKLDEKTGGPVVNQDFETNIKGFYSVGNCLQVYDTVDKLSIDSKRAGRGAAKAILQKNNENNKPKDVSIRVIPGKGINHVIPQRITSSGSIPLTLRPQKPLNPAYLTITRNHEKILVKKLRYATPANLYTFDLQIPKDARSQFKTIEVAIHD